MNNPIVVNGVEYTRQQCAKDANTCAGCAGDGKRDICHNLPECFEDRPAPQKRVFYIFIEKDKKNATNCPD